MTRSKQPSLFPSLLPTDEAALRKKKEAGRPSAPKIALIDLNLVRPNPAEPRLLAQRRHFEVVFS